VGMSVQVHEGMLQAKASKIGVRTWIQELWLPAYRDSSTLLDLRE
jgi:hypothetical protein